MFGFRIPRADEALLISGGKAKDVATPFRVVVGHRAFVMPLFSRAAFLTLEQQQATVNEKCLTAEKIPVQLTATCAFKVPNDEAMIVDAAQRVLSDQVQMPRLVGQIVSGHLRGIAGDMTLNDLVSKRQTLAEQVLDASKSELARQGLQVDSFQITSVDDGGGGALQALQAPHIAAIRRDAAIAEAEATQLAAKAQQTAAQQTADYERETEVTKAGYAAQVAKATADSGSAAQIAQAQAESASRVAQAQAEAEIGEAQAERDRRQRVAQAKADAETGEATARASQAGPLAQASAAHDVAVAATVLAQQQALQRERELERDVVKPALAEKAAQIARAEAEAETIERKSRAAATEGRVSLDQRIVEQLPLIAGAIADGLKGSNLTILNGPDGLTEMATGVLSQARAIYDAARTLSTSGTNGHDQGAPKPELGPRAEERTK